MTDLSAEPVTDRLTALARRSHAVIASHQHTSGAYPASPTFSAYRGYAWFRDGAFTAEGMSRWGDVSSVDRFHDWCARVLVDRADQVREVVDAARRGEEVPTARMLPTRFTLDGADGTDPWWDFQTDGYGMWLWAVVTHAARHDVPLRPWVPAMELAVDYLTAFWRRPCYDWWEEHDEHRHVSTLGAIRAGLVAAAGSGVLDAAREDAAVAAAAAIEALVLADGLTSGRAPDPSAPHLAKWLGAATVDASLAACVVPFGLVEPGTPVARATLDAVVHDLDVDGGVHRFLDDVFYGGGQWTLLSCLVGWNLARGGDHAAALRHLSWVADHAVGDGDLPEQVPDHLLHPASREEWLQRWGPVATPLLWSHGMVLILADELGLLPEEALR